MSRRTSSPARLATVVIALGALLLGAAGPATAGHADDPRSSNLHPLGHIVEPASLLTGPPTIHTDIAFWGKLAFQGNWLGFNIRDISAPGNPKQISFTECTGNQGDVIIWDDVLVRSWNSPATAGATCDGEAVPVGFEGLHVFDVSDVKDPELVASVDLSNGSIPGRCGSHTATGVPDEGDDRLLVYNSGSQCDGFDVVEVPLDDPEEATYLRTEPAGRHCHDTGVILGDIELTACAGDDGYTLWDISDSLEDPEQIDSVVVPGVGIGHSVQFSNDGEVIVFGHEPGGGVQAACQTTNPDADKSYFFYDTEEGELLGTWVLPRPQTNIENCTLHNFNIVPMKNDRDILVHGSYQAGTGVVDFTDPANPVELAYTDPPPIPPPGGPFCGGTGCEIGGVWSSYWYNGLIYETNITEGLNIYRYSGSETAKAAKLGHLNPQTQEFTRDD
ncbi:MAG TPA: hypothetical protein VFV76_17035 [Actinomycetes bacterium]|nr:hypothetical protein [Actinomycetes bacterium]